MPEFEPLDGIYVIKNIYGDYFNIATDDWFPIIKRGCFLTKEEMETEVKKFLSKEVTFYVVKLMVREEATTIYDPILHNSKQ